MRGDEGRMPGIAPGEGGEARQIGIIDAEAVRTLGEELTAQKVEHLLESFDITDAKRLQKFRDSVIARHGHVDTVLSNVGIGFFGAFEEVDLERALQWATPRKRPPAPWKS